MGIHSESHIGCWAHTSSVNIYQGHLPKTIQLGEMAQSIKCWPCKCEDQGLLPSTHTFKKPGMAACACNVSAEDVGTGEFWGLLAG